jgi:hypothetical protein
MSKHLKPIKKKPTPLLKGFRIMQTNNYEFKTTRGQILVDPANALAVYHKEGSEKLVLHMAKSTYHHLLVPANEIESSLELFLNDDTLLFNTTSGRVIINRKAIALAYYDSDRETVSIQVKTSDDPNDGPLYKVIDTDLTALKDWSSLQTA